MGRRSGLTVVKHRFDLVHVRPGPGDAVDAFNFKAVQVDGLDALVDDHGDGRAVALEELVEGKAKDWL